MFLHEGSLTLGLFSLPQQALLVEGYFSVRPFDPTYFVLKTVLNAGWTGYTKLAERAGSVLQMNGDLDVSQFPAFMFASMPTCLADDANV